MPIYEFACSKCRTIFNFFYRQPNPEKTPKCPKCGNKKMGRQVSRFAISRGGKSSAQGETDGPPMPDLDDPQIERAMMALERDMEKMDENDPKQMAHLMRKMKDILPPGTMPEEMDIAIRRLEAGEDPEKIEEEMGDLLGDLPGGMGGMGGMGSYRHDDGLYDP